MSENNVRSIYVYMASKRKPETKNDIDNDYTFILKGNIITDDTPVKDSPMDFTFKHFQEEINKINKNKSTEPSTAKSTLIILCGPPGSGKSTIKSKIITEKMLDAKKVFTVDPDEIRTGLLKYVDNAIKDAIIQNHYNVLSKIVNKLAKDLMDEAINARINIVFDTTGQDFMAILNLLKRTDVQNNYHTIFSVVWASFDTCQTRVNLRNNQLDTERKTDPNVRINLDPKVAADIYCKFVPSKNRNEKIPHGIASNLLLVYARAILNNHCEILLYDNNKDNNAKLVFSKLPSKTADIANFENWSFGVNNVELDNFYDMRINKDPSPDIMHSPNDLYAEYCKLQTSLLKSDSKNVLPPPPSVDLTSTNVLPPPPSFKTSKAKKPKTSHGAGKTKKQHKHKKRNTRKN